MEETGCEVICGAPTTPAVKGLMKIPGDGGQRSRVCPTLYYHRLSDSALKKGCVVSTGCLGRTGGGVGGERRVRKVATVYSNNLYVQGQVSR